MVLIRFGFFHLLRRRIESLQRFGFKIGRKFRNFDLLLNLGNQLQDFRNCDRILGIDLGLGDNIAIALYRLVAIALENILLTERLIWHQNIQLKNNFFH